MCRRACGFSALQPTYYVYRPRIRLKCTTIWLGLCQGAAMSNDLGAAPINRVPTQTFAVAMGGSLNFGSSVRVEDADGDELFVGLEAYNGTLTLGPDVAPGLITAGADNSGYIGLTGTSEAI